MAKTDEKRNLKCISSMGKQNYEIWEELKEHYYDKLQGGAILKDIAYTMHDYEHHCKNIYKIIGRLLQMQNKVFLSQNELLVLNLSVLLHDISMTETKDVRLNHSKVSSMKIKEDFEKGVSAWNKVDASLVDCIRLIVEAHSDVKAIRGGKEEIVEKTLENPNLTDAMSGPGDTETIHARFLAGILRLADELDITRERVERNDERYRDLDVTDEKQRYSKECWEQLLYFKEIKREKTNIKLIIDEEYLEKNISDDRTNIKIRIEKILKKIRDTLLYVNHFAFEESEDYYDKLHVQHVIIPENQLFKQEGWDFSDKKKKESLSNEKNGIKIEVLNSVMEEKITKFVYKNELIIPGHFIMNSTYCGEDWINVRSVVADRVLSEQMVSVLKADMQKIMDMKKATQTDTVIVGIGMNGNILAAKMAHYLKLPFTYVSITQANHSVNVKESTEEIARYKHVILITGVVSTYETLLRVCSQYELTEKIIKIYTVLYRHVDGLKRTPEIDNLKALMSSLCNDFDSKIINKENCMKTKYNSCMAKNIDMVGDYETCNGK